VARTLPLMRKHFPDSPVEDFELLGEIGSTAVEDRHVASAAIKSAPCTLVTWNVAHFDGAELSKYRVAVQTPDTFLCALYDAAPSLIVDVTRAAQQNLTRSAPLGTRI
jgi:hypothetical protein